MKLEDVNKILELMDEMEKVHPLNLEYEDDARYTWPSRWDDLRLSISNMSSDGIPRFNTIPDIVEMLDEEDEMGDWATEEEF